MPENPRVAGVTLTNTVTLTNKTLTTPVLLGVPAANGAIGRDTTQKAESSFDNGMFGISSRVIAAGVGTQTLINSTGANQDFTALITFPSNSIFTNKAFRIRAMVEAVTGTSSVTVTFYLKLGSTTIATMGAANIGDGLTQSYLFAWDLIGRSAAGASQDVTCTTFFDITGGTYAKGNATNQPVTGIPTNGPLALTLGLTYSGTGSTESMELQAWSVEELN